jgi:hypothetical protein
MSHINPWRAKRARLWLTGEISWTDAAIALFALLGVVVAVFSYCATKQYTRVTTETYQASYRPYLEFSQSEDKRFPALKAITETRELCMDFILTNDGNVPAYHIRTINDVSILGSSLPVNTTGTETYLGPHEHKHHSLCTRGVIQHFDEIVEAMSLRDSDVDIRVGFTVDFQGVGDRQYEYYYDTRYNNQIEYFAVLDEGERVGKTAHRKR